MEYLTEDDYKRAAENGISYNVAYSRFYEYEWSKEDAITKPIYKPDKWTRYKDLAHKNGISQNTFHQRIRKSGMTPEQAATTPLKKKGSKYQGGRITPEMWAKAKDNGIKRNTLICRIYHYGWDADKAVNTPVDTSKRRKYK